MPALPTIRGVLTSFASLGWPAAADRLLLLVHHVLRAEPAAVERLRVHTGRRLELQWRPPAGPWPCPPPLVLGVTPAGLFERIDEAAEPGPADLRVTVDLPTPAGWLTHWAHGTRPSVAVEGDAAFAADLAWLAEHLRWDVEEDLARAIGPGPAHEVTRLARQLRDALQPATQGLVRAWAGPRSGATASR